jgi:hypothetical protein
MWMDGRTDMTKLKLTQTQTEQFQSSSFGDILDTSLDTVSLQATPTERDRNVNSQQYS